MGCTHPKEKYAVPSARRDSENSVSIDMSESKKWKQKLTKKQARTLYENEGTIPLNCSSSILELRVHLADPVFLGRMGHFAKSQDYLAILMCWADILEFKYILEEGVDYQLSKAYHIYHKYIKENCVVSLPTVQIPQKFRDQLPLTLKKATDEATGVSKHIFDPFHQLCLIEIHRVLYLPFKKSLLYRATMQDIKRLYNKVSVDDFQYIEIIGQGGFGTVVHCIKQSTGQHYAMKIQSKQQLVHSFADNKERVVYEKEALAKCQHPFIVSMDYAFQTENLVMLVMDLGTSGTLLEALSASPTKTLPEDRVKFYSAEIVLALAHIHRMGLIYRDLKPANVLLNADGHIQLVDMGGVVDISGKLLGRFADGNDDNLFSPEQDVSRSNHHGKSMRRGSKRMPPGNHDNTGPSPGMSSPAIDGASLREEFNTQNGRGGGVISPGVRPSVASEATNSAAPASSGVTMPQHSSGCSKVGSKGSGSSLYGGKGANNFSTQRMGNIVSESVPLSPLPQRAKSIMGTKGFMAPEMLLMMFADEAIQNKGYTGVVDYWSLGVTMFNLLSGELPFDEDTVACFMHSIRGTDFGSGIRLDVGSFIQIYRIPRALTGVSDACNNIISQFLNVAEDTRLGAGSNGLKDIKCHAFYKGIDFSLLAQKHIMPPHIPDASLNRCLTSQPAFKNFETMLYDIDAEELLEGQINGYEQKLFESWDFISAAILKLEMGIAFEMDKYDSDFKVKLFKERQKSFSTTMINFQKSYGGSGNGLTSGSGPASSYNSQPVSITNPLSPTQEPSSAAFGIKKQFSSGAVKILNEIDGNKETTATT